MAETAIDVERQATPRLAVIDVLRVVAMVLVTAHHAVTLGGRGGWPEGVNLGHMGVGLFCGIAGWLAFKSQKGAWPWLCGRLVRVYPAYWLAVIAGFGVTMMFAYKTVSWKLFALQMSGLMYFVPRGDLVNQATWFVSLILMCYAWAWVAKAVRHERVVLLLGVAVGLFVLAKTPMRAAGASAAMFGIAGQWALRGAWMPGMVSPRALRVVADHVYEYFLMHGIFMVGAAEWFPEQRSLAAATLGAAGGIAGAVALRWVTIKLVTLTGAARWCDAA